MDYLNLKDFWENCPELWKLAKKELSHKDYLLLDNFKKGSFEKLNIVAKKIANDLFNQYKKTNKLKEILEKLTGKKIVLKEEDTWATSRFKEEVEQLYQDMKTQGANWSKADCVKEIKRVMKDNNIKLIKEDTQVGKFVPVKGLSDIDEERPNRMKRPGQLKGGWTLFSYRSGGPGLYIQDECREMMQDKYGKDRGEKVWNGLIDATSRGAYFQFATEVAAEKAWLIKELGLSYDRSNYFQYSYYDMWKEWMRKIGQPIKTSKPLNIEPKPIENEPIEPEETETPETMRRESVLKSVILKLLKEVLTETHLLR